MANYNVYMLLLFCIGSLIILSASSTYNSSQHITADTRFFQDTVKLSGWLAPASSDSLKNPLSITQESISKGEELYNMYCFSCHGDTGYGDGPAGGSMGVRPANFHDQKVIKQKAHRIIARQLQVGPAGRGNRRASTTGNGGSINY
jgi:hypothetical protein